MFGFWPVLQFSTSPVGEFTFVLCVSSSPIVGSTGYYCTLPTCHHYLHNSLPPVLGILLVLQRLFVWLMSTFNLPQKCPFPPHLYWLPFAFWNFSHETLFWPPGLPAVARCCLQRESHALFRFLMNCLTHRRCCAPHPFSPSQWCFNSPEVTAHRLLLHCNGMIIALACHFFPQISVDISSTIQCIVLC